MEAVAALRQYWWGLTLCLARGGTARSLRARVSSPHTRVHLYSLALHLSLWQTPHYRSQTFRDDLAKNLRNVALPATGLRLSLVAASRALAYPFVFVLVPLLCLGGALLRWWSDGESLAAAFAQLLLAPTDWFSFWRVNCVLSSYHALRAGSEGYEMEDKLTFLEACERFGLPCSPWLKVPQIVCKHRNEEGGLGYSVFSNAVCGGDWIIQKALQNAPEIARLLPADAPLSTLRLVTSSRGALSSARDACAADVRVLSACWRAGRAGAMTDHSSLLFDVDLESGQIRRGTSNAHWYMLGIRNALRCPWRSEGHTHSVHPDHGGVITGEYIPNMSEIRALVLRAHLMLCPAVPLVGWDVALTTEGVFLLEGNLSCNFFRASFDHAAYFDFVDEVFQRLDTIKSE